MKTIKLTIQYDGTNYSGWQIQPDRITIQGLLEGALKKITGHDIKTIAAGRTDAGVHALEQVVSFRTDSNLSPEIFKRALNALLPDDIRVLSSIYTEADFIPVMMQSQKAMST
jgi:tRNA pseudouridine38-40 synthase